MENFNEDILIDKEDSLFGQMEIEKAQEEKLGWREKEKLANIKAELENCEEDLLGLGWDPKEPKVIPADLDGNRKQAYNNLLNQRAWLESKKKDLLENKDSQEI